MIPRNYFQIIFVEALFLETCYSLGIFLIPTKSIPRHYPPFQKLFLKDSMELFPDGLNTIPAKRPHARNTSTTLQGPFQDISEIIPKNYFQMNFIWKSYSKNCCPLEIFQRTYKQHSKTHTELTERAIFTRVPKNYSIKTLRVLFQDQSCQLGIFPRTSKQHCKAVYCLEVIF